VQKRFFMAMIGLNFEGGGGIGKDAHITISSSRVTKFFAASCARVVDVAVRSCWGAWEGVAALGGAMVERGGVDWSSIHVGSRRKAYRVRNDFIYFCSARIVLSASHFL